MNVLGNILKHVWKNGGLIESHIKNCDISAFRKFKLFSKLMPMKSEFVQSFVNEVEKEDIDHIEMML